MPRTFSFFALLLFTLTSSAFAEDAGIARLFKEKNIRGTIVISSLDGATTYSHNDERAATRMLPASTFKIPNTLIALEEGAIADEKVLKWDGTDKGVAAWNKDQTLESAFKSSCIWFYQDLARRVGTERYNAWLAKLQYGNGQAGPELSNFWLEGALRISAQEQIAFLKRLYRREFPFKASSYELLRKLMIIEQTPAYTLRTKTGIVGWGQKVSPQIGWYVGYLETGGKVWFFAMNMEIARPEDGRLRQELTMAALRQKGILK
ncbi:class D beta-lactamase [Geotalea uraniireducens]|uniref:Beta-lactamase n=1 Tax=Geotalea uraniireducens (strain Rf4) TaxID=351605 RepID=A5G792_GEOUR|nr:class D beta-lactamase [Geotalea uraniireducens]ABQ27660.1 Beta-lactamase [Geotalea uraniireducens Rf4]